MSFCEFNTHAYEFFFNNLKNTGVYLFFLFFFGGVLFCLFIYLFNESSPTTCKSSPQTPCFPLFIFRPLSFSLSLSFELSWYKPLQGISNLVASLFLFHLELWSSLSLQSQAFILAPTNLVVVAWLSTRTCWMIWILKRNKIILHGL